VDFAQARTGALPIEPSAANLRELTLHVLDEAHSRIPSAPSRSSTAATRTGGGTPTGSRRWSATWWATRSSTARATRRSA
jgi:hypothetical protein